MKKAIKFFEGEHDFKAFKASGTSSKSSVRTIFNTNLYETKREIINYSNKITEGLKKPTAKFIMDMLYGLSKNQSVMLSDISRALDENIKLNYTIDRLSKNLEKINDEQIEIIRNNYTRAVLNEIDEEPLVLLDDSEIIKKYGKNLRTYARYEIQVL